MTSLERKKHILKTAQHDGIVSIPEIAAFFEVSVETIRRDINDLCKEGKLTKVHGGAVPNGKNARREPVIMRRNRVEEDVTAPIFSARLIKNGDIVLFDSGDAAQAVAQAVGGLRNVTFITNSVTIASLLLDKHTAGDFTGRIIMIGGELNCPGRFSCSPDSFTEIEKYRADISFITASGVSEDGVSSQDSYGSSISAMMIKNSACSVLVTESEKFGRTSLSKFASLDSFRYIVTDTEREIPLPILEMIEKSETELKVIPLK